jgi:hypothetical protein
MKLRTKSTGYRQAAWDMLLSGPQKSIEEMARRLGCASSGLRGYIRVLQAHGYIDRDNLNNLILVKNTGPRAPSANINTGEMRDWNVNPTMTGEQLGAIVTASGLSHGAWLESINHHRTEATRLRQMINGQRPVSGPISEAAQKYQTS